MDEKANLNRLVNSIKTRDDFVAFVDALTDDLNRNSQEWENNTLERYLEAVSAWTQNMDGYYRNIHQPLPQNIDWRVFGQILLAAKFYE